MSIELKHLAAYLPYEVKVFVENSEPQILELHSCYYNSSKQICTTLKYKKGNDYEFDIDECKLILRPLSDLTKEIEVNGKKIVPIVELAKITLPDYQYEIEKTFSISESKIGIRFNVNTKLVFFGYDSDFYLNTILNKKLARHTPNFQYLLFQKLFEWHFDIFGLIEAGDAIDINTLKP